MKKITSALVIIVAVVAFSSCKKTLDPGGTSAVKVANEWWVQLTQNGQDIYNLGHFKIATYNTAANDNNIWVDDYLNGWQVKFKVPVDYSNLTFSTPSSQNEYYNITVRVSQGQFLPGAGRSRTGNVADSIHMRVVFSDDPNTTYEMNGTSRTRFPEDDY